MCEFSSQVSAHPWKYTDGMPDHKKTNQHLPGMIQRGTLCVFIKPEHSIFYDEFNTGFGRSSVDRRKFGKMNPMLSGRIPKITQRTTSHCRGVFQR